MEEIIFKNKRDLVLFMFAAITDFDKIMLDIPSENITCSNVMEFCEEFIKNEIKAHRILQR